MKCIYCNSLENKVIDSRLNKEGNAIRRRRECLKCGQRVTTYERIEDNVPVVVKKDGRRERFDRQKVFQGLKKACEKRPVSIRTLEDIVDNIDREIQERGEPEFSSSIIGEKIMNALHGIDQVAYVRFASVYREFKDINQFMNELKSLLAE
ncbi:MAG: transcriptional regulator NrdR [Nitrospirota bacterium]